MSYLGKKIEGNFETYYCDKCNKNLALKDRDSGTGWIYDECEHYCWVNISKTCYYSNDERCELQVVKQLKEKAMLKIDFPIQLCKRCPYVTLADVTGHRREDVP